MNRHQKAVNDLRSLQESALLPRGLKHCAESVELATLRFFQLQSLEKQSPSIDREEEVIVGEGYGFYCEVGLVGEEEELT